MGQYKKFWYLLVAVLIGAFSILGYYGFEVYREAPPIPQQYVSESGEKVITHDEILHGQTAWQTTGGMQWVLFGGTVHIKHQTGLQIGFTVN